VDIDVVKFAKHVLARRGAVGIREPRLLLYRIEKGKGRGEFGESRK
jgi:hypothetical protein